MGLFDRLFGSPEKPTRDDLDDPDFGVIWQCDDAMWEGETAPFAGGEKCISLSGDDSGPSASSRSLFQAIPAYYQALQNDAARIIGESTEQEISSPDLSLTHISIDTDQIPPVLELSFRIPSNPEHAHVVVITDWTVRTSYLG